ncbi:hypothetical protein G9A89_020982 [Geosiphon pyriformis]|nr:hypothetical protein G9A89_020982 [Geosiphon pyriformis]
MSKNSSIFFSSFLETLHLASWFKKWHRPYHTHAALTARRYGQPTFMTHPHLIKRSEITPGISSVEYELRRTHLLESLPTNSVAISLGYRTRYMSNKVFYPFHQNTDFFYLCGFNEPDAALILEKNNSPRGYKMTMFVLPENPELERWDGSRTGLNGAIDLFGADEAIESSKFVSKLKEIIKKYNKIYIDLPPKTSILSPEIAQKIFRLPGIPCLPSFFVSLFNTWRKSFDKIIQRSSLGPFTGLLSFQTKANEVISLSRLVQNLRTIKSDSEIKLMREAGEITGKSFLETMKFTNPGISERQIYAKIDYECRIHGAEYLAYVPVVAGGINALTLHYVKNDMPLREGDLLLVDAGGEYHGYVSDVTRTWPVNGKFSQAQRELYAAVLNVNKSCIKLCNEKQNISLNGIHDVSVRIMKEELLKLGFQLTDGEFDRILYPHHVGHYLGLDVHDTHNMDRSRRLKSRMVITIEPGIYVPINNSYPKKYQGLGIRIEDNVLIGETEPVVLSASAPKEIEEIEYYMKL